MILVEPLWHYTNDGYATLQWHVASLFLVFHHYHAGDGDSARCGKFGIALRESKVMSNMSKSTQIHLNVSKTQHYV